MTEHPVTTNYPEHPDDVRADGGSRVVRNYYACRSHCCLRHGCKYGYQGCPVTTGQITQDHPCEACTYDLNEAARITGSGYAKPGEIAYTIVLGLQREHAPKGQTMVAMPTDEQVTAAAAQALAALNLDGWTLTRVLGTEGTYED